MRATTATESPTTGAAGRRTAPGMPLALAASFLVGVMVTSVLLNQPETPLVGIPERTNVVSLDALRSFGEQSIISEPGTYLVLMVPVDRTEMTFQASISPAGAEETVWSQGDLAAGFARSLAIGVPSAQLPPGRYVLRISGEANDGENATREIPFRVVAE